ncbi:phage tail protein [Gallibacterium anatis]|uniref:Phage tail protein n=1 Tax=Gallibacterium anatis TaxID=750 RepID=A0AAX3XFS9_9PAST|nr:phage tail protein [Gallibacterium anatis]MDK9429803.1 phage tail protein [Gallibacterium anatis]WIM80301.1 phage tail protein [Gallibacterium anatis]
MAKQYYSVLTNYGTQVIAGAIASKQPLQITQMAVGDGNGRATTPNSRNTGLVREVHRADISAISVDPRNDKQIIFELTIPENVGGFWIREMGIFDNQNRLVAYANCPDSFKPQLESGSGKVQVVRMILLVSSSDAITLKVDDSVIFVTRGQLTPKKITATTKNAVDETGHSHEIDKASTSQAGIVELDSSINSKAENKAATPKAVKTAYDKAEAANDNANTRVSKSGGEMTDGLKLKANYGALEKKWDYSGFYAGSATLNNEALPYFQIHIGSYGGNTAGYAKSLGFNLIDYKAYVMNWNSEGEYAGKKEILTELHRSDSVTSASSETVATSKAVKDAYDKAVDGVNKANAAQTAANKANNNAESRLLKSGGLITGDLSIRGRLTASNIIEIKEGSEKQNLDNLFGSNSVWGIQGGDKNELGLTPDMYSFGAGISLNKSGTKALLYIPHKANRSVPELWIKTHYDNNSYIPSNWAKVMMVDYIVGIPLPWMLSIVPEGFLAMQGQAFDKSRYPILAQRYPSGRLPDLRGEFIRGWDNGRGVDGGRLLLSMQGDEIKAHKHNLNVSIKNGTYVWANESSRIAGGYDGGRTNGDAMGNTGGRETRPRNIAYQYICLAG